MGVMYSGLAFGIHATRIGALREHPLGEVQALLRLAQLVPQAAQLTFERFDPIVRSHFWSGLALTLIAPLPQSLGP